jgi:integrase
MGRSPDGMPKPFKRKDGRWSVHISVTISNGSKKRICITDRDRSIVMKRLKEAQVVEHHKISYVEKEWKIGDYLDYWLKEVQAGRVRETTIQIYSVAINNHIMPVLGNHRLKHLSVQDVRDAISELEKRGCPAAMRQKCLQVLSTCITCAMREDLVFRNVAQLVERPEYIAKETTIWTAKQAALFLQAAKKHPHYIAFLLFLTYGMRRGEVLGLRYCDIDFDNGVIHVRQQIDRINGVIKARDLKTKNSRRTLPLIDDVRKALLKHANKNGITVTRFNSLLELSTQDTIVVSRVGTPLEPRNLARCFEQLTEEVGLPRIKIHATRHIAATTLKDLNVPIKDVQLILGHANIATTANIYQHGTSDIQRSALSAAYKRLNIGTVATAA